MKRFLVLFSSHPTGPADMTFVDVDASCTLSALCAAKRGTKLQHLWSFAQAVPWPHGTVDVEHAMKKAVANQRR